MPSRKVTATKPGEPRIVEIIYRRNKAVADYEHVHLEARVEVPKGVDPNEAIDRTRAWVHRQLGIDEKRLRDGDRFIDINDEGF